MKKTLIGVLFAAVTTVGTAAFAQGPPAAGPDPSWTPPSVPEPPPPPQAQAQAYSYPAPAPAYSYAPPAPAATLVAPAPAGQWVYTTQYGWLWVPYSASYTYVAGPDAAFTFAYYPRFGWRWIASPWVLGIGATPRWGRLGPTHFAWYGRPRGYVAAGGWHARPVYRPAPQVAWRGGQARGNGHGGHRR